MIRRVIPGTIATELVGVQAMSGPAAQVFTLRHQYEEAAGPGTGTEFGPNSFAETIPGESEVFGNASPIRRFYSGADADFLAGAGGLGSAGQTGTDDAPAGDSVSGTGAGSEYNLGNGEGIDVVAPDSLLPGHAGHAGNYRAGGGSFLEGTGGRKMSLRVLSQACLLYTSPSPRDRG